MDKKLFTLLILLLAANAYLFSQSFAINNDGSNASSSALLDVKSNTKGLLIPRMTNVEKNAILSPATGLLIFQTGVDSIGFYYYNGSKWTWMISNANADTLVWKTGGNTGTNDALNYLGTKDNVALSFRVNNQKAGRIDPSGSVYLGYQAGFSNSLTNLFVTGIGYQALYSNISGTNNTALGYRALDSNKTGSNNTAIGDGVLYYNIAGNNNTATGKESLYYNQASFNTANGYYSLRSNTTGTNNTATGYQSLFSNTTADDNTASGTEALYSNTTGSYNTASGFYSLRNNTTGTNNVAIGSPALYFNTTAGWNIAIGNQALYSQSFSNSSTPWASENIAIGSDALYSNQPTSTTNGYFNTAVGSKALRTNTTGYQNTAFGNLTLFSNTTGQLNAANGWAALYKNDIGIYNTAGGAMAMYYNTSGNYNVGIGTLALHNNVTGSNNTAIGQQAGLGTIGNSYSNNTLIGNSAGYSLTSGSNNVFIGYQAGYSETTGSNKLFIANSNSSQPLIYGDFSAGKVGIGTTNPLSVLHIKGSALPGPQGFLKIEDVDPTGLATAQLINSSGASLYLYKLSAGYPTNNQYIANSGILEDDAGAAGLSISSKTQDIRFYTTNSLRMIIKSYGYVGIGLSNPAHQLELSDNDAAKPGSGTWTIASDARLKTIDGIYTRGLNDVLKLNTIRYHYSKGNAIDLPSDEQFYGFSAQEVQKIYPEAVRIGKAGYLTLDIHPILVSYINAFKEQQQEIEELKKENKAVLSRLEKLENKK